MDVRITQARMLQQEQAEEMDVLFDGVLVARDLLADGKPGSAMMLLDDCVDRILKCRDSLSLS